MKKRTIGSRTWGPSRRTSRMCSKLLRHFNTKLKKSMDVELAQLNLKECCVSSRCYTCRPSPLHYTETANKLVTDLLLHGVIWESGDMRSKWVSAVHFVSKPNRVPLTLRLVVDYTRINDCLIRDQATVFPTSEEIRQMLGADNNVWLTANAIAAYYQVNIAERDVDKTTFLLNGRRYFFRRTVMGSPTWLKASDDVIRGLPGVFKLVDNLLVAGRHYVKLAERVGALLERC